MHHTIQSPTSTRGKAAAHVLILATAGALVLAVLVAVTPVPLGSVALLALVLGVTGIAAAVVAA